MKYSSNRRKSTFLALMLLVFAFAGVGQVTAGEKIVGKWEIKSSYNGEEIASTLSILPGEGGSYKGTWVSDMGEMVIDKIKFEGDKFSLTQSNDSENGEWKISFAGTIAGDKLTGVISGKWGETAATGVRQKSAVFGKWEFESRGRGRQQDGEQRAPQKRVLTLNEDMTGTYEMRDNEVAIKDMKVEGNTVSFKVETSLGERAYTIEFKGTAEGDALNGEFITSRGNREAKGKRIKTSVFGQWEFTSETQRGTRTSVLTLKEDMTGTYTMRERETPITELKIDGKEVSFKLEMSYGENSFTMDFKGTVEGDTLNGEFVTSRGNREAKGVRVGAKPKVSPEDAVEKLEGLIDEAETTGKVENVDEAVAVIEASAKKMDKVALLAKLGQLQEYRKDSVIPRPDKALTKGQKLDWTIMGLETRGQRDVPAEQVKAHPAAKAFPGMIDEDVKRVTKSVEIWTDRPGWRNQGIYAQWNKKDMQSTGLYAAPGELITVTVPENAVGANLSIRIGVHTDGLWQLDRWRRAPEITRSFKITEAVTKAANAFGGPVYIETPHDCDLGKFKVKIAGAVEMPWYVAGETTDRQWKKIRERKVPWAELQTDKVVVTLSAEHVRKLDDMKELMAFWDSIMDSCADLLGKDHARRRAERFATDTQISAGYMHSGYPLMAGLDIGSTMVDVERIKKNGHGGVWGLFHEVGHNHQNSLWVYGGTTEVTVNLFSLYVCEKVCGLYPKDNVHGGVLPANREKSLAKYLANGAKFETWKSDPFLALYMYSMMQEEFGWEPFTKVFAEYRAADDGELPKNDDDKRDQWMVRMSKMVGKDLGGYFDAWGVPVSAKAKESIADLPDWMPENFPEVKAVEATATN